MQNKSLLSSVIAEKIQDMIVQQDIKPGDKLPSESKLAEWYRVSRPTIREAMKTLRGKNLVTIRQGDGTYVSDLIGLGEDPLGLCNVEKEFLTESIFEARLIIEPQIAMLAVERATSEEIKELGDVVCKMQHIDYRESARLDLDMHFHTLIAKSSRNAIFNQLIPIIFETIQKGLIVLYDSEESHKKAQHMHEEIYKAFIRRDIFGAKNAVLAHIYTALDEMKEIQKGRG